MRFEIESRTDQTVLWVKRRGLALQPIMGLGIEALSSCFPVRSVVTTLTELPDSLQRNFWYFVAGSVKKCLLSFEGEKVFVHAFL